MRSVVNAPETAVASAVLPTPASPSRKSGRPSFTARKRDIARPRSATYCSPASRRSMSSAEVGAIANVVTGQLGAAAKPMPVKVLDNPRMHVKKAPMILGVVLIVTAVVTAADRQVPANATAERVRAHIDFLASDLLQGREPGTPGFDIAAEYVASQFRQFGLTPAGENGTYFQPVPLFAYRLKDRGSFTLRGEAGRTVSLMFGEDYLPGRAPVAGSGEAGNQGHINLASASLVFAGLGVVAPDRRRDDYAGLDVRGKVVVVMAGAPAGYPAEERAYYTSGRVKRAEAAKHGAIGLVSVNTPEEDARTRFADGARTWDTWAMTWRQPGGEPFDPVPKVLTLAVRSASVGEKLFQGAPVPFRQIAASVESKQPAEMPRFPLNWSLSGALSLETKPVESRNVAGLIPGSRSGVKDEIVVLSAHLDHIGITSPVNGDAINNGALDNAA